MKSFANKPICLLAAVLLFLGCFVYTDTKAAVKTDKGKIKTEEKVKEAVKPDKEQAKTEEKIEIQRDLPQKVGVQPTPPHPIIERDTSLKTLFEGVQIPDTAKFFQALMRGFPVSPNALGDMNQDSVVNIWDLVRVRNIWLGIGNPPTPYESVEGDLNQDGTINHQDVLFLRNVLLGKTGPPYLIDSTGGEIKGAGVTFSFKPGAIESTATLWVKDLAADSTGLNFASLEQDSIYFMKGFELVGDTGSILIPPSIQIELPSLPACSLKGENLLMYPSVGPFGESQLSFAGNLTVLDSGSTLLKRPHTSAGSIPILGYEIPTPTVTVAQGSAIPGAFFVFNCTNISKFSNGNLFEFLTSDGYKFIQNPTSIDISADSSSWIVKVLAPYNNPGPVGVRFKLAVSQALWINVGNVTTLPLPSLPPGLDQDSIISTTLSAADTLCIEFFDYLLTHEGRLDSLIPGFTGSIREVVGQLKSEIEIAKDSFLTLNFDTRLVIAEIYFSNNYEQGMRAGIDSLRSHGFTSNLKAGKIALLDADVELLEAIVSSLELIKSSCEAIIESYILKKVPPKIIPPWIKSVKEGHGFGKVIADWIKSYAAWRKYFERPTSGWILDPSTKARYKNLCINFWKYRTKSENKFISHPPYHDQKLRPEYGGRRLPTSDNSAETSYRSQFVQELYNDTTVDLTLPEHPLTGAIVTPDSTSGIPGITGIVNEYGIVAIPGIRPGSDVTFSMYDPKTGLYEAKVATAHAPDVSEQGVSFPVLSIFDPDTSVYYYPLALGQAKTDTISASKPRIEYWFTATQADVGKKINIGFHSEEALTFWFQKPSGSFIIRDSSATCILERELLLDTAGTYKITVTYGVAGGDGPFEVGVSSIPYPPTSYLCGNIAGVLTPNLSPYYIAGDITVNGGDSLVAEPGVKVLLQTSAAVTNHGYIHLPKLDILASGNLSHVRGDTMGVNFTADTLKIESGGKIDVSWCGYRGINRDGWTVSRAETYPGKLGSAEGWGGSHGGFGGKGGYGSGDAGDVYDLVEDPFALGSGGSWRGGTAGTGGNGGGLVRIEADVLVLNGSIVADGGYGIGYGAGGAGGTINLRVRQASGTGTVQANGGNADNGWYTNATGGGAGGRIAIRWQTGSTDGWTLKVQGGTPAYNGSTIGGAGTIYLLGPNDGVDGRLIVDNWGRSGETTPLPPERTQFKYASIQNGAKFTIGSLVKHLTVLDSLLVRGSSTQLTLSDSTSLTTPKLIGRSSSVTTYGKGLTLNVPKVWVDSSASFITETNLTFANATDFMLTNGGILDNRKIATFTIPRFEPDNIVSGTFRNWGTLNVTSDSVV
ncbi:MAG: dockerin type I domain-containing protein, partial [candidate division Zixibacteria bacterium]|nr:dockerin type I domain-containing protein [candidate division Zixibacteria bacterium]